MKYKHYMVILAAAALVATDLQAGSCGSCKKSKGSCGTTKDACAQKTGGQKDCARQGCTSAEAATAEHKSLSTGGLKGLLASQKAVVVLDARTGKWDDGERIPGAKALSPVVSAEEAEKAIGSKDALVVTYCSNLKCGASAKLAKQLRSLGYSNVVEYPEGIAGWKEAGNKVETQD